MLRSNQLSYITATLHYSQPAWHPGQLVQPRLSRFLGECATPALGVDLLTGEQRAAARLGPCRRLEQ